MAEQGITAQSTGALSVNDKAVGLAALRMRWHRPTLIRRVETALASRVEQALYLRIAATIAIQPESVALILRELIGDQPLTEADMVDRPIGKNLSTNRFAETVDMAMSVVTMTHVLAQEYGGRLQLLPATRLAMAYGPDKIEDLADSVRRYIASQFEDEIGDAKRTIMALSWFGKEGLTWCVDNGLPYPSDFADLMRYPEAKRELHGYIGWPAAVRRNVYR